jgi:acylphosphatase
MKRIHLIISGRVQGVGFRYHIRDKAWQHNLIGWVRNNDDGSVEIIAEGNEKDIEMFAAYCRKGPALAQVTDLKIIPEKLTGEFNDFIVRA